MATKAALKPLGFAPRSLQPLSRAFSSFTPARQIIFTRPLPQAIASPVFRQAQLTHAFRRHQSSQASKPQRGVLRTILVWTWRITYLSALGGIAYLGYGIWIMRNPADQEEPDPKKKTLVILGIVSSINSLSISIT